MTEVKVTKDEGWKIKHSSLFQNWEKLNTDL